MTRCTVAEYSPGKTGTYMKVSTKMIRNMVLAFILSLTVVPMKGSSSRGRSMELVRSQAAMGISIKANSIMVTCMGKEYSRVVTVIITMVNGKTVTNRVMVFSSGPMEIAMKENGEMDACTVKVLSLGVIVTNTKDSGKMTICMEREFSLVLSTINM